MRQKNKDISQLNNSGRWKFKLIKFDFEVFVSISEQCLLTVTSPSNYSFAHMNKPNQKALNCAHIGYWDQALKTNDTST